MLVKNSNDIENRTRDLPACSAVPQQTAPHIIGSRERNFYHGNAIFEAEFYGF